MLKAFQILVTLGARRLVLVSSVAMALGGCGQKGGLYLPLGAAAAGRATLAETLSPAAAPAATTASAPPVTGTASPIRAP